MRCWSTHPIQHTVHHCVSLMLQVLWVHAYINDNPFVEVITTVGHMNNAAMVSSIFSSLRHIIKATSHQYYGVATRVYKVSYVVSKMSSAMYQYMALANVRVIDSPFHNEVYIVCMGTLCCLHGIQAYFVCKIADNTKIQAT